MNSTTERMFSLTWLTCTVNQFIRRIRGEQRRVFISRMIVDIPADALLFETIATDLSCGEETDRAIQTCRLPVVRTLW